MLYILFSAPQELTGIQRNPAKEVWEDHEYFSTIVEAIILGKKRMDLSSNKTPINRPRSRDQAS